MGCESRSDSEENSENQKSLSACTEQRNFPTLNIHTENSFVKIGDEFRFSKNVLIVVPDDTRNETSETQAENEDIPHEGNLEEKLTSKKLRCSNIWWFGFELLRTHKASFALMSALAAAVLLLVIELVINSKTNSFLKIPDFVNRSLWGSQRWKCPVSPLEEPVALVIIHHTSGTLCINFPECQQSVKNAQNWHLSLPYYCDVRFGFLVGGDCRIYEGRNFSQREEIPNDPFYKSSLEVAFIGDYSRDLPSACQINIFLQFLNDSVSAGHLHADFKVVGALQVYRYETKSPGKHLMDEIQHWSMWSNKTLHRL